MRVGSELATGYSESDTLPLRRRGRTCRPPRPLASEAPIEQALHIGSSVLSLKQTECLNRHRGQARCAVRWDL